jgi:hypothetical protein
LPWAISALNWSRVSEPEIHIEFGATPSTLSLSRYTSSAQPMSRGSWPLVITLWLMTVSDAMCPR